MHQVPAQWRIQGVQGFRPTPPFWLYINLICTVSYNYQDYYIGGEYFQYTVLTLKSHDHAYAHSIGNSDVRSYHTECTRSNPHFWICDSPG